MGDGKAGKIGINEVEGEEKNRDDGRKSQSVCSMAIDFVCFGLFTVDTHTHTFLEGAVSESER